MSTVLKWPDKNKWLTREVNLGRTQTRVDSGSQLTKLWVSVLQHPPTRKSLLCRLNMANRPITVHPWNRLELCPGNGAVLHAGKPGAGSAWEHQRCFGLYGYVCFWCVWACACIFLHVLNAFCVMVKAKCADFRPEKNAGWNVCFPTMSVQSGSFAKLKTQECRWHCRLHVKMTENSKSCGCSWSCSQNGIAA